MRNSRLAFSLLAASIFTGNAHATLIVSSDGLPGEASVIDFSQFPDQTLTVGPVQIGTLVDRDVVFTATHIFDAAGFSAEMYGFGGNGIWFGGTRATNVWVNPQSDGVLSSMRFTFADSPVSFVGGFMNYCSDVQSLCAPDVFLRALGSTGEILEQYNLAVSAPILTPNATNDGAFRGIARSSADIFAFEFVGVGAMDDLTFSAAPRSVPEPGTLGLFMSALVMFGVVRRKRVAALS
jgi:hypothetical protein